MQQPQRQPAPPGQSAGFGQPSGFSQPAYNSNLSSFSKPPSFPSNASQSTHEPPYPHSTRNVQYPNFPVAEESKELPEQSAAMPVPPTAAPAGQSIESKQTQGSKLAEFNFAESNAKFSKEALAQEVAGGSPSGSPSVIPPSHSKDEFYNKNSSFFDNISSTTKERFEGSDNNMTGYQRRGEERKLNMETFGQDSVYNNRGRGRGRGRNNYRGRDNYRGRGNYNNGQGFNQFQPNGGYQGYNQGRQNFNDTQ